MKRRREGSRQGAGSVELDEKVFGIQPNMPVMHQVVTAQLAARRAGTQSTKTRAEVRGGGAKPWKQKGTGRGRRLEPPAELHGGGVAHAPKPRSYAEKTPKKMVNLALRSALSDRAADERRSSSTPGPSTSHHQGRRKALEALGSEGRTLLVLGEDDEMAWKSFRNLASPCTRSWPASSTPTTCSSPTGSSSPGDAADSATASRRPATSPPTAAGRDREATPMRDPRDVIIQPIVSEKSYALLDPASTRSGSTPGHQARDP